MVDQLNHDDTGQWLVTTASGSQHLVDLDDSTVTRMGAPGHEWPGADGRPFRFLTLTAWDGDWSANKGDPPCVGKRMYVNDLGAWRLTTDIVSIEKVEFHGTKSFDAEKNAPIPADYAG